MLTQREATQKLRAWSGLGMNSLRRAYHYREEHDCTILEAIGMVMASGHAIAMKADTPERRQELRTARDLQTGKDYAARWREQDLEAAKLEAEVDAVLNQEPQSPKPR